MKQLSYNGILIDRLPTGMARGSKSRSFKRDIAKGTYICQTTALKSWYKRVTSTKVEKHLPKQHVNIMQPMAIIRKRDGTIKRLA